MTPVTGKISVDRSESAVGSRAAGIWLGIALVLAVLVVYWPVSRAEFVDYDDYHYIHLNQHVQTGLTLPNIGWALTHSYQANWHPLTWISHMLDVQLFGASPRGPHLVNLTLHIFNSLLLFVFLKRFVCSAWAGFFIAGLFALHPLHVESVAWIAERKDVLSTFFALLTMLFYGSFARQPAPALSTNAVPSVPAFTSTIPRSVPFWLALGCYALGLMSKPMLVTLPFVLLLLDFWPFGRLPLAFPREFWVALGQLGLEKVPFFLLSAVSSLITFLSQKSAGAVQTLFELSFGGRVENAVVAYLRYLGKTFWPADLCCFYPHPGHWPAAGVLASLGLLLVLTFLAVLVVRKAPFCLVGWLWYLGTLVPVIGLVQVGAQSMADRYSYIPIVGLFLAAALGLREMVCKRLSKVLCGFLAAAVLFACAVQTRHQVHFWLNTEVLFQRALAVTKANPMVREFLANHYFNQGNGARDQGNIPEAVARYKKGLEMWPAHSQLHNNLGSLWHGEGQLDQAIEEYLLALKCSPTNVNARNNLAVAYSSEGKLDEAIEQLTEILRLTPDNPAAHNNLGALFARKGNFEQAIVHYKQAIVLAPAQAPFHDNLGDALAKQGQLQEAIASYGRALALNPADSVAAQRLRNLYSAPPSNSVPANRSP